MWLKRIIENALKWGIRLYQFTLSPLLHALAFVPGTGCRFVPSCSDYAHQALGTFPLHRAVFLIGRRLFRCHPFSRGGLDNVPPP